MRLVLGVFVIATLSFVSAGRAFAAGGDKSNGCGPGWYIADKNTFVSSTTRQVTHVFLPPTFSMTSGTSGCAQHSIVLEERRSEHFVTANYDRLREELAQGNGEFLEAFLDTMSCDAASRPAAAALLQNNFDGVYGQGVTPAAVVERARALMQLSSPAMGSCVAA